MFPIITDYWQKDAEDAHNRRANTLKIHLPGQPMEDFKQQVLSASAKPVPHNQTWEGPTGRRPFEESPAYKVLSGMLETKYRVNDESQLDVVKAKASRFANAMIGGLTWPCCTCGGCLYITTDRDLPHSCPACIRMFEVPNGHIRLADDGEGNFLIYGTPCI